MVAEAMSTSFRATDRTAPPFRVLVVDDNRDAADSLGALLRLWGHDTVVAYEGADAVEAARAHRPDLLLLDVGWPGLGGSRLARELRRLPELAAAKLVAVTGRADQALRCLKDGFDCYLVKPVDPESLHQFLAALREGAQPRSRGGELARIYAERASLSRQAAPMIAEGRHQLGSLNGTEPGPPPPKEGGGRPGA
jgi:CheY-like chemotaxis protein